MSKTQRLNQVLRSLQAGTPEIEAAAVISEDGLIIASVLPQAVDEMRVAGMSATLVSLGERATAELKRGELQEVLTRGSDGYAVLIRASPGTLLLSLTTAAAKLGLVFLEMRNAVAEIRTIL